jgi:hypothetical protein
MNGKVVISGLAAGIAGAALLTAGCGSTPVPVPGPHTSTSTAPPGPPSIPIIGTGQSATFKEVNFSLAGSAGTNSATWKINQVATASGAAGVKMPDGTFFYPGNDPTGTGTTPDPNYQWVAADVTVSSQGPVPSGKNDTDPISGQPILLYPAQAGFQWESTPGDTVSSISMSQQPDNPDLQLGMGMHTSTILTYDQVVLAKGQSVSGVYVFAVPAGPGNLVVEAANGQPALRIVIK